MCWKISDCSVVVTVILSFTSLILFLGISTRLDRDEVPPFQNLRNAIAEVQREGIELQSCLVGDHKVPLGGQLALAFEHSEEGVPLSCSYCQCDVQRVDEPAAPRCFIEDCSASYRWCSVDSGLTETEVVSVGHLGSEAPHPCCKVCPPRRPPSSSTVQPWLPAIDPSVPYVRDIYSSAFRHLPDGLCRGLPAVLLVVTSLPAAADRRALLRRLYQTDAAAHSIQLAFLLGRPAAVRHAFNDFEEEDYEFESSEEEARARRANEAKAREAEARAPVTQRAVDAEAAMYGDIIQSDVPEHYFHLGLKTVSLLDVVRRRCPRLRLVAKTDDDVFVNIRLLAKQASMLNATGFIYGQLQKNPTVSRSLLGWYSSEREWPWHTFPQFVLGPGYLISNDVIDALFRQALRTQYHHLEDVFVTGIVAEAVGVARSDWPGLCSNFLSTINVCRAASCVFTHKVDMDQLENTLRHLVNVSHRFPVEKMCQQPASSSL